MTFNQLKEVIQQRRLADIDFGESLLEARDNFQDWIGEGIDAWHDFLAQPETGITTREANELIKLFEFVAALAMTREDVAQIPKETLKYMINHGGDIEDAKVLTVKDFKEKNFEVGSSAPQSYQYMVMKKSEQTGNMRKIHGVDSDEVLEAFREKINGI